MDQLHLYCLVLKIISLAVSYAVCTDCFSKYFAFVFTDKLSFRNMSMKSMNRLKVYEVAPANLMISRQR